MNGILPARGPTRLQLSLQHAAADQEGGSPSVGQWIQFRNAELASSIAQLGGDVCLLFSFLNTWFFVMFSSSSSQARLQP